MGLSSDDIFRRAQRERRRQQQRWITGLSIVALVLAGLAIWAEINRREAEFAADCGRGAVTPGTNQ